MKFSSAFTNIKSDSRQNCERDRECEEVKGRQEHRVMCAENVTISTVLAAVTVSV